MHIEPGVVDGAKLALSYATAAGASGLGAKLASDSVKNEGGLATFAARSAAATALVFSFFQVLPHAPIGVSEVHLILGSTLFLILGAGPAAVGLALGLLLQGLFFAPADMPQYGMNVTTLLVPLFAISLLAKRIIPADMRYADLSYRQALTLSTSYQGGIVAWVAFWAFYGQGFALDNLARVAAFGAAYMSVVLLEPLVDLAVLAIAKQGRAIEGSAMVQQRVYHAGV